MGLTIMIDEVIRRIDANETLIKKFTVAKELLAETNDEETSKAIEKYLNDLRDYQVDILLRIKSGDEKAFEEFLNIKDIRNFVYYYAWHIRKYFRFYFSEDDVVHEIQYQMYYIIRKNYRIYNQPNEISLLINSMRSWIRQKVSGELLADYKPKKDMMLSNYNVEDQSQDTSELWVREIMDKTLSEEDTEIFELRFFDGYGYKQIGQMVGKSKDAIQRRYNKILDQIKDYLESEED